MSKIGDKLFDLCPSWLYGAYDSVKSFPKELKWKVQRANGKVPACDWWDFDVTLANVISQGLENLLYRGNTDWEDKEQKKIFKDLEYVYKFFKDYSECLGEFTRYDSSMPYEEFLELSKKEYEEFAVKRDKAFKLLSKHFRDLWD